MSIKIMSEDGEHLLFERQQGVAHDTIVPRVGECVILPGKKYYMVRQVAHRFVSVTQNADVEIYTREVK